MLVTALELAWAGCAVLAAWLGVRLGLRLLRRQPPWTGDAGPAALLRNPDVQGLLGFGLAAWLLAELLHRITMT
ncbi:hypothetical protein HB662_08565 [Roseomonas frigidaquae]|uniref:Uncharacterized protein n=1 Tax=Falsiroseomonas frigidaquae TaxID=487318 RepID=A0ABX1EXL3_9PROT|nr:hypothetical protein [Falsiroseomonas frigidaquae]NKE44828.1 hypothetical protein [Falsiroseomonas frigidaquae]